MLLKYSNRTINNETKQLNEPTVCPHCNHTVYPNIADYKQFHCDSTNALLTATYKCPNPTCSKIYLVNYLLDHQTKKAEPIYIYPSKLPKPLNPLLHELSPRFIESYRQANVAENNNCLELAGAGYRNALEILIKDYAMRELNEAENKVTKMRIADCIKTYLSDVDLSKTADVVRILGNDNTHYQRKYDEIGFKVLKTYMDIFITLITTKLMIAHPPVSR